MAPWGRQVRGAKEFSRRKSPYPFLLGVTGVLAVQTLEHAPVRARFIN